MKNIYLLFALGVFIFLSFSCGGEQEEVCMSCRQVTYDNSGIVINETNPKQYCGQDLTDIENLDPVVTDSTETKWECEL